MKGSMADVVLQMQFSIPLFNNKMGIYFILISTKFWFSTCIFVATLVSNYVGPVLCSVREGSASKSRGAHMAFSHTGHALSKAVACQVFQVVDLDLGIVYVETETRSFQWWYSFWGK